MTYFTGKPWAWPKHDLVSAAHHKLKGVGAHQLEIVVLEAVVQAHVQPFGGIEALGNPHIIGGKLHVGDESYPQRDWRQRSGIRHCGRIHTRSHGTAPTQNQTQDQNKNSYILHHITLLSSL